MTNNAEVDYPEVVSEVAVRLATSGVPTPRVDARRLVEHVVAVVGEPTGCGAALLDGLVVRRRRREPLQLILGSCAFRYLDLVCRPGVFVPRPETEVVAGLAIDAAREAGAAPVVLEPCTGAGPILCSLVAEVPGARVIAGDRDERAVALAGENLDRLVAGAAGVRGPAEGAAGRVVHGELFSGMDPRLAGRVDVVVANPPYLPAADADAWPPEVAGHDPTAALIGGGAGHEVVAELLVGASEWLRPGGVVVVEIDARVGPEMLALAGSCGLAAGRVHADLTGAPRVLTARRPVPGGGSGTYAAAGRVGDDDHAQE